MEHMLPYCSSFLAYYPSTYPNNYSLIGDESPSNIARRGTAVFSMNRSLAIVCNALHVPYLRASSYSAQRRLPNQAAHTMMTTQ